MKTSHAIVPLAVLLLAGLLFLRPPLLSNPRAHAGDFATGEVQTETHVECTTDCVPPPAPGCIDVLKETFDQDGNTLTPVPQFTFSLDGGATQANDGSGRVRFEGVASGEHVVTEDVPDAWEQVAVTPAGGNVSVEPGSPCAVVSFKNRQIIESSSSSLPPPPSSSEPPAEIPPTGCIIIVKQAYEADGSPITPVPQFSYLIDGGHQQWNDGGGYVSVPGVPPGTHTVDEQVPEGWQQVSVTPSDETVNVMPGTACAVITFRNARIPMETSSAPPFFITNQNTNTNIIGSGMSEVPNTQPLPLPQFYSLNGVGISNVNANTNIVPAPPAPPAPLRDLRIQKTADRSEAMPGDAYQYVITVRNTGDADVNAIAIDDTYDPSQLEVTDAGGGNDLGGALHWDFASLAPGESIVVHYRVRLAPYLREGDAVRDTATVTAVGVPERSASYVVRIFTAPPPIQTGVDPGLLTAAPTYLTPITADASSSPSFWFVLVTAGMSTGGFIVRRMRL